MTREERKLLLKDLCARLPYYTELYSNVAGGNWAVLTPVVISNLMSATDELVIKPYLRPMSSMTDDEREDWYRQSKVDYDCEFNPEPTLSPEHCHLSVDWLNKKMFDYRGLIPMGLALETPEGMYEID